MPPDTLPLLALLFLIVGALYSSVGHAGASGYLAVMALLGVEVLFMRPTVLSINVRHFSWRVFWPFAVGSVPAAFIGGMIQLPSAPLKVAIGVILLLSAARMGWTAVRPPASPRGPHPPALPAALGCGVVLGLVSGLTGTGGGIFLSPIMLLFNWADTKRTAATAAVFILVNSMAGLGGLASRGWTPPPSLALLAAAAGVGGVVGATYGSRRATPRMLMVLLAGVLLVAGAKLVMVG
jgi:uncharacterized membrane protein YfcA